MEHHKLTPGAGWRAYLNMEENLREYFNDIWFYSNLSFYTASECNSFFNLKSNKNKLNKEITRSEYFKIY